MHIATSFTKIKYIMYNVQDYSVLNNNTVRPITCEGDILLSCGKHLRDRFISLRGEIKRV